jgi:hypothetical protein
MDSVVVATDTDAADPHPRDVRRRIRRRSVIALAGVVLIAAAWGTVHVIASRAFDDAASTAVAAERRAEAAVEALGSEIDEAARSVDTAGVVGEASASAEDLVDGNARAGLATAADATAGAVGQATQTLEESPDAPDTRKPLWTWELLAAAPRLSHDSAALEAYTEALDTAETELAASTAGLQDSALTLYASVPAQAAALEATNLSARAVVLLDLREAARTAAAQTTLGSGAEIAFTAYATAAASLKTSQQAELAEKGGPLLATRLAIEEYARSIAGGVVLDFDWAPIVNGLGGSAGMAGTATWNTVRGGFSTITLSNSVAQNWPSADAKALVAHEVGHAITSKCSDMFDSSDRDANEAWATAWAISMGHTALGSGVQAYGYPPASLIETAATCR